MIRHPAKYSNELLPILHSALIGHERVLDPFAGTGKLRTIRPDAELLEIEPEWAALAGATVGDALAMPWPNGAFDAVCCSPCYANRMADHHEARDASRRNTYRHALGRPLHPNNSGQLQWGKKYREFHYQAWQEVRRVLRPGGRFVLNISDHIRKGKRVRVARFHRLLCLRMGFRLVEATQVKTPRQRQGQNGDKRVANEWVFVFEKRDEEGKMGYNDLAQINSRGAASNSPRPEQVLEGELTMPHSTRTPRFPTNLDDCAPALSLLEWGR